MNRFNPTLVRLRPACRRAMIDDEFLFQSHAGSIEASPEEPFPGEVLVVSIPRWFD